ncbi:uncharacterized protein LOC129766284 [Toxorhynchites rutilus septentrionalis]|uniref:uncharacterized protein LOC129766284 n=1 Tax=Toxorhynchites rutilus septentrionalis TaxID=329112 RepID=UPI00247AD2CD|nr:uncharacterized protein LOC129766284 [Toxorhynchites rutilus septentrionalis]
MTRRRRSQIQQQQNEEENSEKEEEMNNDDEREVKMEVSVGGERFFHPEELKQLVPVFKEGIDVKQWIEAFDHYRKLYLWSEKSTLLYASCRLAGAAHQWFLGVQQQISSWRDFKRMILLAFPVREDEVDIHRKLSRCIKDSKESYDNYVFRMNALGQKGKLSNAAIIKYTISGLSYDALYPSIASRQYDSIYELLNQIRYCEANQELFKRRSLPARSQKFQPTVINTTPKKPQEENQTSIQAIPIKRSDECYNCHGSGHISINCPQPQRRPRCGVCRKVGHEEQNCFKRNQGDQRGERQQPVESANQSSEAGGSSRNTAYTIGVKEKTKRTTNEECKFLEVDPNSMLACDVIIGGRLKTMKAMADSVNRASDRDLVGVNDSKIQIVGTYSTSIVIDSFVYVANLTIVTDTTMKVDLLMGRRFLQDNGLRGLTFRREVAYDVEAMKNVFDGEVDSSILLVDEKVYLDTGDTVETRSLSGKAYELFERNYLNREKPGESLIKHCVEIKLKEDRYYNATPLRLSDYERKQQNRIVQEMMSNGIVRESDSPYSSRVVLTRKKNGEYRLCVNFEPLNKLVERDHFPLPIIEDQIAKLQDRKYFTSLDMKNGFYHVDIAENSRKYLSFVTEEGQYEFNKLPFGYTNSPSIFARYVMKVLKKYVESGEIVVFIDDILVSTVTIDEHFDLLSRLFRTLADNHIELNMKKCSFLKTGVEFLGYYVTFNQIRPSNRLIENNRRGSDFKFEAKHFESFERLKEALISKPVLSIYSPKLETQLHTDASSNGFGGILVQHQA